MGKTSKVAHRCQISLIGLTILASVASAEQPPPQTSPVDLIRRAVHNEVSSSDGPHFMFKDYKRTPHGSEVRLIVETRDATAGMTIEHNGHPLSPEQTQAEDARLSKYANNPSQLDKKRRQEKDDADHTRRILEALPDAFLYQADGTESGSPSVGHQGDELLRFEFKPNPNYNPPSHVEQVLTGMYGHILVDAKEERIAEIDGTLKNEVGFGWGILGHLDPGGRFVVQQADVGEHHWEVTHMQLAFTGKVLFFKKLNIHSNDTFTDFRPVPANLSFAQGIALLKKQAQEAMGSGAQKQNQDLGRDRGNPDTDETADESPCCSR